MYQDAALKLGKWPPRVNFLILAGIVIALLAPLRTGAAVTVERLNANT